MATRERPARRGRHKRVIACSVRISVAGRGKKAVIRLDGYEVARRRNPIGHVVAKGTIWPRFEGVRHAEPADQ